jgi:thioredoxin reductase (NADPH)
MQEYDLVVIGAGLGGLTAALFGARFGLRTAVVEQLASGGQILNIERIDNFPGFPQGIAGYDLGPMVQEQAENAGAEFISDTVTGLDLADDTRLVRCDSDTLVARTVIIAAGSSLRNLGIPGEQEFFGRGVSHCASCDAPLFANKDVCVVGGADSALDEAAVIAGHARRVLVVHRRSTFSAQPAIVNRLAEHPNIETMFDTELVEISGSTSVDTVTLRTTSAGEQQRQPIAGVFVFVGLEPNTGFLHNVVDLDAAGHVIVDQQLQTSIPGIFAAGDLRQHSSRLLVSAAGDGATAAANAQRYLTRLRA